MLTLLQDGVIALLASFGVIVLLWLLAGALSGRSEGLPAVLLVPLRGQAERMEYTVRMLQMHRSRAGGQIPIVLMDAGMDDGALRRAQLLADEHGGVLLMSAADVADYWGWTEYGSETDGGGNRT
ncbi:MAG: hypothetical protein J5482_00970 [Oscillospiraceae bacterium]|nr:hypothetical protein [Oscillospiraceae bacterium]